MAIVDQIWKKSWTKIVVSRRIPSTSCFDFFYRLSESFFELLNQNIFWLKLFTGSEVKRLHIKSTMGKPFTIYGWVSGPTVHGRCRVARVPNKKRCRCDPVTLHQWLSEAVWIDATLHVLVAPLALSQTMFHSWWRIDSSKFARCCDFSKVSSDTSPHTLTAHQTLLEVLAHSMTIKALREPVTLKHWPCPTTSR